MFAYLEYNPLSTPKFSFFDDFFSGSLQQWPNFILLAHVARFGAL
jgi:hypothetical protein